jgi:DNA-directed RNA polymerase II subunit RPB1
MSLYRELSYEHDFDQIKGIQFCVLGPDEIESRSVVEVFKTETYNGNIPVHNGLFDPRMGVIDYNQVCVTCQQKNTFCPGHFGHVKLAKPVFYIQFYDTVRRLLKCVCTRCSKLLVDPESDEVQAILSKKFSRQKKWEAMYKLCAKKKRCGQDTMDGCGAIVPTINKENMLKLSLEWKDDKTSAAAAAAAGENKETTTKKQIITAEDVLRILKRISDRDAEVLGFHKKYNRPEWMICTMLPVPPPTVRPSVRNDTGVRQEDDLTHKLLMIIKVNNSLKAKMEKTGDKASSKDQIDMLAMLLQWEIATMIDNTVPGIPPSKQRTGRPMRSLTERLKGKEGRIRGNLMGKRVDFSARSVITPDPNISIDELGVPIKIAMNLTFPEIVNKYNKSDLVQLVRNGPDVYPGAKTIRKRNGAIYKIKSKNAAAHIELEDGDVVDRHLRDGDVVLFNRQPSLHRMSMMSHRVRVMPFNTFRLNVTVTPSYNAD